MPKVTQQYRDARRDHILAAARRCFLRDGFHATSMQDLFGEAGLSSGAVYRYFASKDEVIMAIAEENTCEVLAMMHAATAQHPGQSAGAALADALEVILARDSRDGLGGLALLVWAEALRSPGLAAQFRDLLARLRADLATVVREQQRGDELPGGVRRGRGHSHALGRARVHAAGGPHRAGSRVRGAPRGPRPVAVSGRIRRCYPRPDRLLPWRP